MAQSPLILFGGASATVLRGRGALQDIDQISLIRSAVKAVFTIKKNCDFIPVIESAFASAISEVPGPIFIECPIDLLYDETLVRQWYAVKGTAGDTHSLRDKITNWYLNRHLDKIYACNLDTMSHESISPVKISFRRYTPAKAVRLIDKSKRPLMIVGSQVLLNPDLAPKLIEAIGMMNIPVYLTGMSRGLLGVNHPLQFHHKRNNAP